MWSIILLSLLGVGATAALAIDVFDDDDDDRPAPDTPGEEEPETGGPDPEPETPTTGGPGPLPEDVFNQITGTPGADALNGTEETDFIDGLEGDDVVRGGDGDDIVDAGDGDDRVFGQAGEDIMAGNDGDDFLRGGADSDILIDSDGADTLRGDTGDDVILATGLTDQAAFIEATRTVAEDFQAGNPPSLDDLPGLDLSQDDDTEGDVVDGGAGSDILFFGQGDSVSGGDGADLFIGGETLTAGDPAIITDFEVNEETLVLTTNGGALPTLEVTNDGGDAVLTLDGETAVILQGVGATFTLDDVELIDLTA